MGKKMMVKNRFMYWLFWITFVSVLLISSSGCSRYDYVVETQTDLRTLNGEHIATLSRGTKLRYPEGRTSGICIISGNLEICELEVIKTGQVGWVNDNHIKYNK
jgi:hypothetical protein